MVSIGAGSVDAVRGLRPDGGWKRSQETPSSDCYGNLPVRRPTPPSLDFYTDFTEHQIDPHGWTELEALPVLRAA
jgi:hypothetical protein